MKPGAMVGQRKRPLLYIYDLPSEFNTRMHQYRINKVPCGCSHDHDMHCNAADLLLKAEEGGQDTRTEHTRMQ